MGDDREYCDVKAICMTRKISPEECKPNSTFCPYYETEREKAKIGELVLKNIARGR